MSTKFWLFQAELDSDIQSLRQTCDDIEGKLEKSLQEKRDLVAERKDREDQLDSYSKELDALRQENLKLRQNMKSGDGSRVEEEQSSQLEVGEKAAQQQEDDEKCTDQIEQLDAKDSLTSEDQRMTDSQGVVRKTTSHIVAKRVCMNRGRESACICVFR